MVAPTEQRQVRERGRPAVGPVANVMALAEREAAAREAATFVAVVEHAPERGRNGPGTGADLFDPAIRSVPHHHPARVARQAPRRFRGNVCAVLEERLPRLIGIGEGRGIDVDDHLVSLSRSAGIDAVVEGRLREQRQCVATRERSARRAPRCRPSRSPGAAPRSRAWPRGSGRGPWSTTALRAPVPAPAAAGCPTRAPRARARARRPGRARPATSASRRRTGSRCSSRRGRQTRGSDRAGGRWRRRGVRRARRSRRRGGPAPRRSRRWVQRWARCRHETDAHRRLLLVLRRLYTPIFEPPWCLQNGRSPRDLEFFGRCPAPHASARMRAAGRASARNRRPVACLARNVCQCPILDTSARTRGAR